MALTAGRNRKCTSGLSGGVKAIYLVPQADIDSVTVDTDSSISAITMVATKVFYKYQFRRDTASFNEEVTNENCTTQTTNTIAMTWAGLAQADINTLKELLDSSCCGLAAVVEYNTGVMRLVGHEENEYLETSGVAISSGAAKADAFETVVTITGTSVYPSPTFTGTVPV